MTAATMYRPNEVVDLANVIDLTLAERLHMLGIPVIPEAEIEAHKRAVVRSSRVGIWRWLHPIPRACVGLYDSQTMHPGPQVLWIPAFVAFTMTVLMAALGAPIGVWAGILGGVIGLIVGIALPIIAMNIYRAVDKSGTAARFFDAGQYWWSYDERLASLYVTNYHPKIDARIRTLRTAFDGTSAWIRVDKFGRDPLYGIVVGDEIAYFGAKDTGSHLDHY
jgi:hypothetical protein